jgi:formate dehydrogenase iron-sulfur subunit
MTGKRMLIDTSKCIGCKACQVACQQWHSLTAEDTTFTGTYTNPPELSGTNLTLIKFIEKENAGKLEWLFLNDRCRHCENPNCKTACPRKAIKRQLNGIVRINPDKCDPTLCSTKDVKPCQEACPFKKNGGSPIGIPKRDYVKNGSPVTTKMMKCDFCYNRLGLNGQALGLPVGAFASTLKPACEVTCAPGAIKSGPADKMKRKANKRVTYLKANGYPNANVYPAGLLTHVIWVLLEPPYVYGIVSA